MQQETIFLERVWQTWPLQVYQSLQSLDQGSVVDMLSWVHTHAWLVLAVHQEMRLEKRWRWPVGELACNKSLCWVYKSRNIYLLQLPSVSRCTPDAVSMNTVHSEETRTYKAKVVDILKSKLLGYCLKYVLRKTRERHNWILWADSSGHAGIWWNRGPCPLCLSAVTETPITMWKLYITLFVNFIIYPPT